MVSLGMSEESLYAIAADKSVRMSQATVASGFSGFRMAWVPAVDWYRRTNADIVALKEDDDGRFKVMREVLAKKPDVYPVVTEDDEE
jgi:hypothetical protein